MASDPTFSEPTDEEIQRRLSDEGLRGPRFFRSRELAKYTPGLRDLVMKVVSPQDTAVLHDATLIYILAEAHGKTPEDKLARRGKLLRATDDREKFRLTVNVEWLDELSDAEIAECKRLVDDILAPVKLAQVAVVAAPGKKKARAAAKPSRTARRSSAGR